MTATPKLPSPEFGYYAAHSGLTPPRGFSLGEHQLTVWRRALGPGFERAWYADARTWFFRAHSDTPGTVSDAEFAYYAARSGLPAGALSDHKAAFFAQAAPPEPWLPLDPSPYPGLFYPDTLYPGSEAGA